MKKMIHNFFIQGRLESTKYRLTSSGSMLPRYVEKMDGRKRMIRNGGYADFF